MPNLLIINENQEYPVDIPDSDLYLGRAAMGFEREGNFVGIPDDQISRRHVRILQQSHRFLLQDLNSTNGTFLRGNRIEAGTFYPLNDGDEFNLGQTTVRFRFPQSAQSIARGQLETQSDETRIIPSSGFKLGRGEVADFRLNLVDEEQLQPSVSMVLDASMVMQKLQQFDSGNGAQEKDLLRRLSAMAQVSISLGAIKDRTTLWKKVAECIFDIFSQADYINLLLYDEDKRRLYPSISRGRNEVQGDHGNFSISYSIINDVLKNKRSLMLIDAMGDERFAKQESVVALELKSVMCAPLLFEEKVLGLIQVDTRSASKSFEPDDLELLTAIASQIAISVKNMQLFNDIEQLFEGFVTASVQVIEARDPVTAGHSFRVAEYTQNLVKAVDAIGAGPYKKQNFSSSELREIRYAALLHDFGKVGVREDVLTKSRKLYEHETSLLKLRFQYAGACIENAAYKKLLQEHEECKLSEEQFAEKKRRAIHWVKEEKQRLSIFLKKILHANKPTILPDDISGLEEIAAYTFNGIDENEHSLITPFEFSTLSLVKGSLNPEERIEIESHVSHTYAFLNLIPWTNELSNVTDYAYAHHEKLDGSGYPRRLRAEQIPLPSRIMTIADIFDALTSGDRPYKAGLPTEQALDILYTEANANKIEKELLEIFIDARAFVIDR